MATLARSHRIIVLGLVAFMLTAGCAQTDSAVPSTSGRVHVVVIDDGV